MIDRYILQALQQAVTAAVAASTMPALDVKYVTVKTFEIPASQKYLECVFAPNNISNQFWGSERTYRGIFRLILHWPVSGGSAYEPMDLLASIAAYFTKERKLSNPPAHVQIYDVPDFTGPLENGHEVIFPLTLLYRDFQP